jgi:hypothetical protein
LSSDKYSRTKTLSYYTNELIKVLGEDNYATPKIKKKIKDTIDGWKISEFKVVNDYARLLLEGWIRNKNSSVLTTKKVNPKKSTKTKKNIIESERDTESESEDDTKSVIPDKKMQPWINIFMRLFKKKAIEAKIKGWNENTLKITEVVMDEKKEHIAGYYDGNAKIVINTFKYTKKNKQQFIDSLKNSKNSFELQNIKGHIFRELFDFVFPASTCIHELEHARRHQGHDMNTSHQSLTESLWNGDVARERTFDQSANDIFSRVISFGFYEELLKEYKKM